MSKRNESSEAVNQTTKEDPERFKDRVIGSILGVFIGDALGMGVHWQYDLDKLEADRGYVRDYLDPLPGTYHSGTPDAPGRGKLVAGQLEQQGVIDKLLLQSLAENKCLDQNDFHRRLEDEILKEDSMDGTRQGGKYGWSDKTVCDIYKGRIVDGKAWEECVSKRSDTPDSIVRAALIAALYNGTPREMCRQVQIHSKAVTGDSSVLAHSVALACLIAGLLQGLPLDANLSSKLYSQAGKVLPFSTIHSEKDTDEVYGAYTEPDSLLWFGNIAAGVKKCKVEPAHRGVDLYGKFCAFFATLPSAYYCAARFPENFEKAVCCAVNGGGQTTMRASLAGALVGARVGLSGIPKRYIEGLDDSEGILALATRVADAALERRGMDKEDTWCWDAKAKAIGMKKRKVA